MLNPTTSDVSGAFDLRDAMATDLRTRNARLLFAAVFAAVSCLNLHWAFGVCWMAGIILWEFGTFPPLERIVARWPKDKAISAYALTNMVGSALFSTAALANLAQGSALGVAIGATWLTGSFMSSFVYWGNNKRLLWACLAPGIAVAVLGPLLSHGLTLEAAVIGGLILTALAAAHSFSRDHQVLLERLAERQGALSDMQLKLSMAVEASGDGMFEIDLRAALRRVSPGQETMLGYSPGELRNPLLIELVHPEDREAVGIAYGAHLRGETPHTSTELRALCKDGTYKWVLARARLVARTPAGDPWKLVGTTIDLSSRKAMEQQLETARDLAESANAAKSMFLANMSHEIRTPLNGVIGVAGALARTELTDAQREMVGLVQGSGQVLERLLSDVLDQSKIEAGEFTLQIAPFDLRETVEGAVEVMRVGAEEKGLAFHVAYGPGAEGTFEGDAVRIRQILTNLVSNAVKFTKTGEVRVAVDALDAGVGVPTAITVSVCDTGIGYDGDVAKRLFNRFVQADGSISRQFGGTGLGLSICKTLSELMGGAISASSQAGVGSVFTVRLPLARALALQRDAPEEAVIPEGAGLVLEGMRILLAEDHPINQRVAQLILEPLGAELTIVSNGAEAIDALAGGAFDLVLMDMQMPVMDGLAATREIRRRERATGAAAMPIAMLSANAMQEHLTLGAAAGANWHIAKPITPQTLLSGVLATFAAQARAAEPPKAAALAG